MVKQPKSVQKSVRMTEKVYQAVDNFDGTGFNDKFENMVEFCVHKSQEIQRDIDYLNKRKTRLYEELDNLDEARKVVQNSMIQLVDIEGILQRLRKRLDELPLFDNVGSSA